MLLTKGEKNLPCPCGVFISFASLFEGATIVSTIGEVTAVFEGVISAMLSCATVFVPFSEGPSVDMMAITSPTCAT